jgi:hypothetical protein
LLIEESGGIRVLKLIIPLNIQAEGLARRFHELYEELAPAYGYETRKESAVPWEKVPEKNRRLMVEVCRRILAEGEL